MNRIDLGGRIALVTGGARHRARYCRAVLRFRRKGGGSPIGRFVLVEDIEALVPWLASEECSFSTGGVFNISGGRATY